MRVQGGTARHATTTNGAIINVATDLVARPSIPYHEYTTAKSALIGFSRNLAVELGPLGIRATASRLVGYPTEGTVNTKEMIKDTISANPLGRIARPETSPAPSYFSLHPGVSL